MRSPEPRGSSSRTGFFATSGTRPLPVTRNDAVVLDMPLQTAEEVPAGTMTQRAMDAAVARR
jgi:hypothetical protein